MNPSEEDRISPVNGLADSESVRPSDVPGAAVTSSAAFAALAPDALMQKLESQLKSVIRVESVSVSDSDSAFWSGRKAFAFTVEDKEQWKDESTAKVLLSDFGKLAFETTQSKEDPKVFDPMNEEMVAEALDNLHTGDLEDADKVYVVSGADGPEGLLMVQYFNNADGQKGAYVIMTVVDSAKRNQGVNKALYSMVFTNERDVDAFIGNSATPGAVSNRIKISDRYGFDLYFGHRKFDDSKPSGERWIDPSADDEDRLKSWEDVIVAAMNEVDLLDKEEVQPRGYVVCAQDSDTVAPLERGDVHFSENPDLQAAFEDLLRVQEKCDGRVTSGMLINLRRKSA